MKLILVTLFSISFVANSLDQVNSGLSSLQKNTTQKNITVKANALCYFAAHRCLTPHLELFALMPETKKIESLLESLTACQNSRMFGSSQEPQPEPALRPP